VVLRPTVTYADTVLWLRVKLKTSQAELSKLQRTACLGITGVIRTPTAAIEVLLGLPPPTPAGGSGGQGRKLQNVAIINGNPNLKVLDMHDSGHEKRTHPTDGD
jgi:hypothetical protein